MRLGFVLFGLLNFNTPFTFGAELQERLTDSISVTASPYVHLGELSPLGKLSTSGQDIEAHHGQHGDVVQISSGQALTSIPGCFATGSSNRTQRFNALMNSHGNIQSISLMGACEKGRSVKGLQDYALVVPLKKADITPVQLKQPAITQTYNEDGSEKKPEPEKTFLQKYWMYLLPVVILMLTSSAAPPPQEEGQAAAK